ncbi:alpha-amylase family glycosyl hydrolase [Paenibacillus xylanivorans]|uniref:Glycosyl hydrolase family 13 catalytic domain-containing protein n=1 Tax=Paenibacillus xylanivorans TaxID=1705561 RepID=A0A0N0C5Z0_9BACL|nr:alpha-amylase family glycosyl hydrolase [Paenibacillus xylanivorans]KOY17944.1 hypothetical protein AMS66_03110 [Paenibacillus xylanivorans]
MDRKLKLQQSPEWTDDLIIYEIPTKSFTSPNGPESGTFASLKEKLGYLKDLGITGIWLTGHSLSHPDHFYNIWNQYAVIQHDKLDPSLGGEEEFLALIEEAHRNGIKVFLDVITHGVMSDSPLIDAHPEWFKGGSWGMTDFDWFGDHEDLDDWWVKVWVDYVQKFGIDGFRLDVATYRFDLWARIRSKCSALGHPIVIIPEKGPAVQGVTDFLQHGFRISNNHYGLQEQSRVLSDLPSYLQLVNRLQPNMFQVKVLYEDDSETGTGPEHGHALTLEVEGKESEPVPSDGRHEGYEREYFLLSIRGIDPSKQIKQLFVRDYDSNEWQLENTLFPDYRIHRIERHGEAILLSLPMRLPTGQKVSFQLSCHDDGWEGYPVEKSPYVAQGKRSVFGYSVIFAPAIPVFMAGEEFDAQYRPLPRLSPYLFGGQEAGCGKWLYGSWIEWSQLEREKHRAMLEDVKQMIRLRKKYRSVIKPLQVGEDNGNSLPQPAQHQSLDNLPVPYYYQTPTGFLLIASNPYHDKDSDISVSIPDCSDNRIYKVTDEWNGVYSLHLTGKQIKERQWRIKRDQTPRGGLMILAIEPLESE